MNIDELTIGQAKELANLLNVTGQHSAQAKKLDRFCIGQEVIIRTYSAGVWFGMLDQKSGNEVILKNARRMWQWKCKESISLSGIVVHGIDQSGSRIAPPVEMVWLEAIEILPICGEPAESIRGAQNAKSS